MNRKIKFRVWDKICKEMIIPLAIYHNEKLENPDFIVIDDDYHEKDFIFQSYHLFLEKDAILMQFTGLLDKNGKEIYEGDIVNFYDSIKGYVKGEIVFEAGAFIIGCNKLNDSYSILLEESDEERECETVEVIGNKFENPELLEQSK